MASEAAISSKEWIYARHVVQSDPQLSPCRARARARMCHASSVNITFGSSSYCIIYSSVSLSSFAPSSPNLSYLLITFDFLRVPQPTSRLRDIDNASFLPSYINLFHSCFPPSDLCLLTLWIPLSGNLTIPFPTSCLRPRH